MKTKLCDLVKCAPYAADYEAVISRIHAVHETGRSVHIVTLNAEMALAASADGAIYDSICRADIVAADSISILCAARVLGVQVTRQSGIDLAWKLAHEKNLQPVGLVGGTGDCSTAAQECFRREAVAAHSFGSGPVIGPDPICADETMKLIADSDTRLVCVGFGHGKQERWIVVARQQDNRAMARVWIGVGGAIDVWSGRMQRAPVWMQRCGLEWLWRVLREPRRAARIFRAVVVFPVRFFCEYIFGILKRT